jgi:glycosyltransferase involved in cell wall biosynthesis
VKVLHVVIDGELGGGQLVARALMDAAREAGDEALLVSAAPGPFTDACSRDGICVEIVDVSRTFKLRGLLALSRLIRRERVDLVHTHGMTASNVLARTAARLTGTPVLSHLHSPNTFRDQAAARTLLRFLDNATARWCATIVAVSDAVACSLVEQGMPADRIEVVHNGYDPPIAPVEPATLPGLEGARLVVCVGRLEPAKGQADLMRAAPSVPGAVFVLVGRDVAGHRADLARLAATLGVADRVVFTGVRDDVLELAASAELLALPSWTEGLPITPLEAMAVGTPVVATAVGGTPEIVVDGETGLLVPARDPQHLAEAINRVLDDPSLAARLGEAGRRRLVEHFSQRAMTDRILELEHAAAGARRRPL